jgi:ubiquinone/menaquinone biosynthesis C-methylase UbiE
MEKNNITDPRSTQKAYDESARVYEERTGDLWEKFPPTLLRAFADLVKESSLRTVLDVGSGPGRDALEFQKMGLGVVCLDNSQSMIEICHERGLTAVKGDFNSLPFEDESFGGVFAYTSLLHVPKPEIKISLREIYRVLETQGIFASGFIEGNGEEYRDTPGSSEKRWFSFYSEEEMRGLLSMHGFDVLFFERLGTGGMNLLNFISRKRAGLK